MARNPRLAGDFVHIEGKQYPLARQVQLGRPGTAGGRVPLGPPAYRTLTVRTQEGDPLIERQERYEDWSRGIGDGRDFIPGGELYATGVHLPLGRITVGADIGTVSNLETSEITALVASGNYVSAAFGTKVYVHTIGSVGWGTAATLPGSVSSFLHWRGGYLAAVGDDDPYQENDETAVLAGLNSWEANSGDIAARALGLSRTSGTGATPVRGRLNHWSRMVPEDEGLGGEWGAEISIGGEGLIRQVFSHNYSDYVLKSDGLYSFGQVTDEATNLLGDLETFPSEENRWVAKWHNTLLVCTVAGLYRIYGGVQRTTGIEECELNTIGYDNPTAAAGYGRIFYEARKFGTKTVIIQYRLSRGQETSLDAPFTPISIVDVFDGKCLAMLIHENNGEARLWYGAGPGQMRHLRLTPDGSPAVRRSEVAFSMNTATAIVDSRPTVALSPTYFGSTDTMKYLRKIELSTEGAGVVRVEVAGETMEGDASEGHIEEYMPATMAGRRRFSPVIKLRGANPQVLAATFYFGERPITAFGAQFGLRLRDRAGQLAYDQLEALRDLTDGPAIKFVDPDGEERTCFVGELEGDVPFQYGGDAPPHDIALTVREVLTSAD